MKRFSSDDRIAERFVHEVGDALPVRARVVALLYDFQFSGTTKVIAFAYRP